MDTTSPRSTRTRKRSMVSVSPSRIHSDFSEDTLDSMQLTHDNQDADVEIGSIAVSLNHKNSSGASHNGQRKRIQHACENCRAKKSRVSRLAIAPYH